MMRFVTNHRTAIGLGLAGCDAPRRQLPLKRDFSGYLNKLKTAKGEFTQINDEDQSARARFYIQASGQGAL